METVNSNIHSFQRLKQVFEALRDPETGCPWDLKQTHASLLPYLIEEAYEFIESVEHGQPADMREELGDVLLQVMLHAQIAQDNGAFTIVEVMNELADKLIERHPHVFGDTQVADEAEVVRNWQAIKAESKKSRTSYLDGSPTRSSPALHRAYEIGRKVAKCGFDWDTPELVLDKVAEECGEIKNATNSEERQEEIGDLLFTLAQLARHYDVNPEQALQRASDKFCSRFTHMESQADSDLKALQAEQLELLWEAAKKNENGSR